MEFCISAITPALPRFNLSVVSSSPSSPSLFKNDFLQSDSRLLFNPLKKLPVPSSRQLSFLQNPPHKLSSTWFMVSAAPSAVDSTVTDKLPADIQVTETPEPNSRVRLSVEVPAEVCDDCYRRVIKEFMKRAKVPGFRAGKNVPESILIGYVGKETVQKATIESILKRTLPHAMSSVSKRALEDSVRISTKFPEMEKTYSSMKSLRYDVIVDVAPEVKWIPENGYQNLKIVVEIDKEIDAQTAAEQELRRRHKALGALKIVTERGLEVGDVAVLDISATTIEQDESAAKRIPSADSKALVERYGHKFLLSPYPRKQRTSYVLWEIHLSLGMSDFPKKPLFLREGHEDCGMQGFQFDTEDGDKILPDFVDSVIGIKRGETKYFPYVFPQSWKQEDLRGVSAQFTVECKELFYRDLPELDDSLADRILSGCTTIEEVRETLLQKFLEVEQTAKEQATDNAILDQLQKMIEVDIPQSLFEEQARQIYGAQLLQIQANMKLSEQKMASLSSPKAVKEFMESQKENITSIIKQNIAVGDIFKRENLQILSDELIKEVENSIAEFKRHNQEYDEERVRGQVQEVLEGAKVLEWLRERADIQYKMK